MICLIDAVMSIQAKQALDATDKVLNPEFIQWLIETVGVGFSLTVFIILLVYKLIIAILTSPNMVGNLKFIVEIFKAKKKIEESDKTGNQKKNV